MVFDRDHLMSPKINALLYIKGIAGDRVGMAVLGQEFAETSARGIRAIFRGT